MSPIRSWSIAAAFALMATATPDVHAGGVIRIAASNQCQGQLGLFQGIELAVVYSPHSVPSGPESIRGVRFRIDGLHAPAVSTNWTVNPAASVNEGNINEEIHVEFSDCMPASQDLFLGTVLVGATQPVPPWVFTVVGPLGAANCPLVTSCAAPSVWIPTRGTYFYVSPPSIVHPCTETDCEIIAVEPSTWSAIKSVYR